MLKTYELKNRKLLSGLAAESLSSDVTDITSDVTTSRTATKLFGPTSCSAKRSDLDLLPKVRYVRKKVRACVGKERAAK